MRVSRTPTPTSASGAGTAARLRPARRRHHRAHRAGPAQRGRRVRPAPVGWPGRQAVQQGTGHPGRLRGPGADRRQRPAGVGGAQGPADGPGPAGLGLVHPQRRVRPGDRKPRAGWRHLLRRLRRPDPERQHRHGAGGQLLRDRDRLGASPAVHGGVSPAGQGCAAGRCTPEGLQRCATSRGREMRRRPQVPRWVRAR
jgi:hypothetical protein